MQNTSILLESEMKALLDSLRRDLRKQQEMAQSNSDTADYCRWNARQVKRILEALNPRGPNRAFYNAVGIRLEKEAALKVALYSTRAEKVFIE
jgi:hypothetical protein